MKGHVFGGVAPLILNLGTRRRWRISFTPRPPYAEGKNYVIHWLGG